MQLHILFGPTRIGKSKKAQELWSLYGYPIVSVDSRKVYVGMDIGTNKLEALRFMTENPGVLYGGLDLITPAQTISVYEYQQHIYSWISKHEDAIRTAGGLILHGGTGLYLDALLTGLDSDVPRDDEFRKEAATLSVEELQGIAQKVAPDRYARLNESDVRNPRRLVRVIENGRTKGVSKNSLGKRPPSILQEAEHVWYDLETNRDSLYTNIDARVARYIEEGWLHEVETLLEAYGPTAPGLQVMGYKELVGFMTSNANWRELVDKKSQTFEAVLGAIRQQHRNYAKRQITWGKKYTEK